MHINLANHLYFNKSRTRTFLGEVPADEGGVDVLEEDDGLLRRHTQQVVQPVVGQTPLAQVQHTDRVLKLTCKEEMILKSVKCNKIR